MRFRLFDVDQLALDFSLNKSSSFTVLFMRHATLDSLLFSVMDWLDLRSYLPKYSIYRERAGGCLGVS